MPYENIINRSDTAALIPEEVSNQLLSNLQYESAAMSLFPQIRMSTTQTRMPVLAALPTAYWVTGDTGLKQTTEMAWSNKYINVEELAAIVPIPENVLADNSFDVWSAVRPHLEQAIGRSIDQAIFFGINKPNSWPDDIVTGAGAVSHEVTAGTATQGAGGLAKDFSDLFAKVEASGYDVDFILANRNYKGKLRAARTTQGERLSDFGADSIYGVGIQYPLRGLWPSGSGSVEAIAGNRSEGIIGIRQDLQYKVLDQAVIQDNTGRIVYNLPQQDMVALRVTFRLGFTIANTINYDQPDETQRYPFAVLKAQ